MNLSIIVPILNESGLLPAFLDMLSLQRDIEPELILVDGGSVDGTIGLIEKRAAVYQWPLHLVSVDPGRARQLNAGADKAGTDTLLFLHVDSVFRDHYALSNALAEHNAAMEKSGSDEIAGHFRLKFERSDDSSAFGYYFWECKARLDRPECTHGDQGFLLSKSFFSSVGPFDVDVPIAEDTRLAERVRATGKWHLLSPEIWTSARRFEIEGLHERQTLNALVMNFADIGWSEFFAEAKLVYQAQNDTDKLDLIPFFKLIDRLNRETPMAQRLLRWFRTGIYVRPNAWQLAFLSDVKKGFRDNVPPDQLELSCLRFHDRWFELLTDNIVGRTIAMLGTWAWYRLTVHRFSRTVS